MIERTGKMRIGTKVMLFGAKTGVSHGTFNAIESTDQWPELNGKITSERVVTGTEGIFARPGDSGGFVINEEGELVGMLFGGPDQRGGPGYVTPIEELVADIRARTGRSLELYIESK